MNFHIIIPARFASTRLPGKVLIEVGGKPLIQHVYERALLCNAKSITIAVDDKKVQAVAESFGATTCMTAIQHTNGSERLAEVAEKLRMPDDDIVVNIQGDEPLIPPFAVQQAVGVMLKYEKAGVATLCNRILKKEELLDPNIVKVALDKRNFALYFSRAAIPWDRVAFDLNKNHYYRHIGLYAYRVKTLKQYCRWERGPLEEIEKLEQLRLLWQGEKIHVSIIEEVFPAGIDTKADLEAFSLFLDSLSTSTAV